MQPTDPETPPTKPRGIAGWIRRVETALAASRQSPETPTIHALRVSLRNSRAILLALGDATKKPGRRERLRRDAALLRPLYRAVGALRDAQVLRGAVASYRGEPFAGEPGVVEALDAADALLAQRESAARQQALRSVRGFRRRRLATIRRRAARAESSLLQRPRRLRQVARDRLELLHHLNLLSTPRGPVAAYHDVRIAAKRLRAILTNLVQGSHDEVRSGLKRIQETLGEMRDTELVREAVVQACGGASTSGTALLVRVLTARMDALIDRYEREFGDGAEFERWAEMLAPTRHVHVA